MSETSLSEPKQQVISEITDDNQITDDNRTIDANQIIDDNKRIIETNCCNNINITIPDCNICKPTLPCVVM